MSYVNIVMLLATIPDHSIVTQEDEKLVEGIDEIKGFEAFV